MEGLLSMGPTPSSLLLYHNVWINIQITMHTLGWQCSCNAFDIWKDFVNHLKNGNEYKYYWNVYCSLLTVNYSLLTALHVWSNNLLHHHPFPVATCAWRQLWKTAWGGAARLEWLE